jgi:hypothetical protein
MNLYIEVENGAIKNHPAFEDNLIDAFGEVPSNWEPFVRVECPRPGVYQVLDSTEPTYEKVDGVWTDVWALRDMSVVEIAAKQQAVKDAWENDSAYSNYMSWTFDVDTCSYISPIPYPADGKTYIWRGVTSSWFELPQYPEDGKSYKLAGDPPTWVEITP